MKEIWYIHGLNCSSQSFKRIIDKLPKHTYKFIDYNNLLSLEEILYHAWNCLPQNKTVTLIGHSLGGIISVLLAHESQFIESNKKIDKVITVSSPFGGSKHANILKWVYPEYKILKDISTKSGFIEKLMRVGVSVPTLSLVSVNGDLSTIREPNDGIVTIDSQMALNGPTYIKINANHFEVLQNDDTINNIKKFIFSNRKDKK